MLTYPLPLPGKSLSQSLYACIREDILSGRLSAGEKLPSKRALAEHLQVSKTTVENAYYQLTAEGYVCSAAKRGYFVEQVERRLPRSAPVPVRKAEILPPALTDLSRGSAVPGLFPFSVWAKLGRRVLSDRQEALLEPVPFQGTGALRLAIARYLGEERGLSIDPENMVIGAGSEYLYGLLVRFFGPELRYGVEDPGFPKIRKIYRANSAQCVPIPLDGKGVRMSSLEEAAVQVLHITPSHSYPSGQVTPLQRRQELLAWAEEGPGRYIIEDDYDSEFRFDTRPLPSLQGMAGADGPVVYLSTCSRSLAPSIRIAYMVLPEQLLPAWHAKYALYSGTVSRFEQQTLARFITGGYFTRHLARERVAYKARRDALTKALREAFAPEELHLTGLHTGLHLLAELRAPPPDDALRAAAEAEGVRLSLLSDYDLTGGGAALGGTLVLGYGSLPDADCAAAGERLKKLCTAAREASDTV